MTGRGGNPREDGNRTRRSTRTETPTEVARDPVFVSKDSHNLGVRHSWVPFEAMDPRTAALQAAEAEHVGPGDFRILDENASMLRPPVGRGFQVWKLQGRLARLERNAMNGDLEYAWGPIRRGCTPARSLICTPSLRGSAERAVGRFWKYPESPIMWATRPAWRPMPNWVSRPRRTSRSSFRSAGAKGAGAFLRG